MICFKKLQVQEIQLKTISRLYAIDRKFVGFFKFIMEGYDGIAVVETIDPQAAIIKLHIAPGCESDVLGVLTELQKEIQIEPVSGTAAGSF